MEQTRGSNRSCFCQVMSPDEVVVQIVHCRVSLRVSYFSSTAVFTGAQALHHHQAARTVDGR